MSTDVRWAARLCWSLHSRQEVIMTLDLGSALLFVVGCIAFYSPSRYNIGVTLFLLGSILMLASVAGRLLLRYGPSE